MLADFLPFGEQHYKELWRKQVVRLLLLYSGPLLVAIVYFSFQYNELIHESNQLHLQATAESHASTLNLFLLERVANLENLIDDPRILNGATSEICAGYLESLVRISETFVDLGLFDESGVQTAYAGPYSNLENRNYGSEPWYERLRATEKTHIVTDIYLGFREKPHFTIGVKRVVEGKPIVLRATLGPERIYAYMRSLKGAEEVAISIVNRDGYYQLVTPHIGTPLEASSLVPPPVPSLGAETVEIEGHSVAYAYSWLEMADWALIVQPSPLSAGQYFAGVPRKFFVFTGAILILVVITTFVRAKKLVALQKQADRTQAQLEHAAKLASVGELAAGIAHEINNPLAVINEEAGLLKDFMDPSLSEPVNSGEWTSHLDSIQESVFRCRDITHKLLKFVRKTDVELQEHDIHQVIDSVVDGLLGRELALSNIEVIRRYDYDSPRLLTDRNQLQQVFLNILNNAVDALEGKPGRITVATEWDEKWLRIAITDTGPGITQDQLGKIFLPFYTTKGVGKGTGLGLSVSYGIVKDLGGEIEVESALNVGSSFTIRLPFSFGRNESRPSQKVGDRIAG
ncbi:MAG TPA: ATP-binding protein [Acidobacteriota bacterium]|nr:ATP-binding protein [Acidobacteriota bacterium]